MAKTKPCTNPDPCSGTMVLTRDVAEPDEFGQPFQGAAEIFEYWECNKCGLREPAESRDLT